MKDSFVFQVEFFEENDAVVGLCPQLNVSSFGETLVEAKASLQEAIEAFIEECEAMGTLESVLAV
jgi:predicted RNase H-like HicB family nuclease